MRPRQRVRAISELSRNSPRIYFCKPWIFYGLAVVSMMRMRRTEPELPRAYRCWGYPWVPVTFVTGATALTIALWLARARESSIGLALILSGLFFLSPLAEEASRQSVTRRQVPAPATRARTNPAPDGVRLARCPA